MKILCSGATRGESARLEWLLYRARDLEAERLLILGNFGFDPGTEHGEQFLAIADHQADHFGVPIWWIDGEGDNQRAVRDLLVQGGDEMRPIQTPSTWVQYLPRGCVVDVDGKRLLAYGGGYVKRTPFGAIDFTHLEWVGTQTAEVDLLATYLAPTGGPLGQNEQTIDVATQRVFVGHLIDAVNPALVVNGMSGKPIRWLDPVTRSEVVSVGRIGPEDSGTYLVDTACLPNVQGE